MTISGAGAIGIKTCTKMYKNRRDQDLGAHGDQWRSSDRDLRKYPRKRRRDQDLEAHGDQWRRSDRDLRSHSSIKRRTDLDLKRKSYDKAR